MELFDEDLMKNEKTDNKKVTTIIMVIIIFLIIMMLLVIGAMAYINLTTLKVTLNGQESTVIKNMIKIDEKNPQNVYVPIKKISSLLGYDYYTGDYTMKSEEPNQCYVECENEVAMFTLSSKTIYKTLKDDNNNYEYFTISSDDKDAVISLDGEMYTTIDGIEKAFNVQWDYNLENKTMDIYTLPNLVNYYSQRLLKSGTETISEDFNNQKAVLEGMLIVEKKSNSNTTVGVIDVSTGQPILETKYEGIEYLEHTKDFLITSENKKGIISSNRRTLVKLQYDDIELMDYENKLYLVKNGNNYGVIDFNGKNVISTDYSEIGIDNGKFKENNIKSKYVIAGSLIPVKSGERWGFFNVKGNQVTDFKYDSIGYVTSNNKANSGFSLLLVPDYDAIVVGQNEKYTVMFTDGKEAMPMACDSIYMSIYGGETTYLFEYDSNVYSVTEQLDRMGYGKNTNTISNSNQQEENNEQANNENAEENNVQENNENVEENNQQNNEQQNNEQQNNEQQNNEE
ncbi:MAG: WG repeat-containing protein [Clostridia bacterium]|nr:WG repeat-containing protein [Clostridia bacterium]